jgi:small-conductance mechanosensitive channel
MAYNSLMPAFLAVDLLGVLGILVWHFQGQHRPTARLIVQILFFACMTTAFVVSGIPPHRVITGETDGFALYMGTAARVLWWIHLAWATIGFIRLYIVLDRRPQEARLLQDLIVTAVYLGVTLSIVGFVFGAPIGTLVATSGVVAIILGLALQNTLGDLFSGIALTLGRPFSIGDWIQLADGTEGHVVQNNWRSTQVLTPANNLVVLPNSTLAKVGLTNLTKPDESHLVILPIRVTSDSRPDVELQFRVTAPAARTPARNEVIDTVHQRCATHGLSLAMPAQSYLGIVENSPLNKASGRA